MTNRIATTLEAYERWAPRYPPLPHNPLMRAEQDAMLACIPNLPVGRVLDLACGTGRYSKLLAEHRAIATVAVDFSAGMLRQGSSTRRVCASMMQLPFGNQVFDLVLSGLAVGHAPDIGAWMAEAARVLDRSGTLLYSDFHPDAARAGLPRTFKDDSGSVWTVPHHRHDVSSQLAAATSAGLTIEVVHEIRAGLELREPFPTSAAFYRRWHGLPLVLVVRARK